MSGIRGIGQLGRMICSICGEEAKAGNSYFLDVVMEDNKAVTPGRLVHYKCDPANADTISVPRDVAREFVRTHMANGMGCFSRLGVQAARETLRAALLTADPTLLDEPAARVEAPAMPTMTAELLAALRHWDACIKAWAAMVEGREPYPECVRLMDAIERAGIVQPRPTDDEIAAAREVIERAGMKVTP